MCCSDGKAGCSVSGIGLDVCLGLSRNVALGQLGEVGHAYTRGLVERAMTRERIEKSIGITRTERWLGALCERTFLGMWSYPSPKRDDGKELCDLLVAFENTVVVFFDREGQHFGNSERDFRILWERWRREVVDRQIASARGADRYLRSNRALFLDAECKKPFPLSIAREQITIHKVIVAHGAAGACKRFCSENLSGSLAVCYGASEGAPDLPFVISLAREDPVHVLDSETLPILLTELDTVTDLTWYLQAKTAAIQRYDAIFYCGEEDLLANYYLNYNDSMNRHFIGTTEPGVTGIAVAEGEWQALLTRHEYIEKKKADRRSYFWDALLHKSGENALAGEMIGDADVFAGNSPFREMAKEPRFFRRALSDGMLRAIEQFPDEGDSIQRCVTFLPSFFKGKAYVFLQLHHPVENDESQAYRAKRCRFLEIACGAAKNKFPDLQTIIGIAIDAPKLNPSTAEDFLLLDCRNWTAALAEEFRQANEVFNFFGSANLRMRTETIQNFPRSRE